MKKMQCLLCLVVCPFIPRHLVHAFEWNDCLPKPNQIAPSIHHLLCMHHQVMGSESDHEHHVSESCRRDDNRFILSSSHAICCGLETPIGLELTKKEQNTAAEKSKRSQNYLLIFEKRGGER